MKMKKQLNVTQWEADHVFDVSPKNSGSGFHRFSAACLEMFQRLEERISNELSWRFATVRPELLRHAVNEAAALAATTSFPALFLPVLAEEKVFLASRWQRKQRVIQERSWLRAA
jgi:hypothetical protein